MSLLLLLLFETQKQTEYVWQSVKYMNVPFIALLNFLIKLKRRITWWRSTSEYHTRSSDNYWQTEKKRETNDIRKDVVKFKNEWKSSTINFIFEHHMFIFTCCCCNYSYYVYKYIVRLSFSHTNTFLFYLYFFISNVSIETNVVAIRNYKYMLEHIEKEEMKKKNINTQKHSNGNSNSNNNTNNPNQ